MPACDKTECKDYGKFDRCNMPYFRFCIDYSQLASAGEGEVSPSDSRSRKELSAEIISLDLNEGLEETFKRNHPHLYRTLQRKLWQNWHGVLEHMNARTFKQNRRLEGK